MNICFITPQVYPCFVGGIEIFNYHLIKNLAAQGYKIKVITCCDYNWENKNITLFRLNAKMLIFNGPSIILHTFLKLLKIKYDVDIVHVPYTSNSLLVYPVLLAHKLFGIRYVISIHGGGLHPWFVTFIHKSFFQHASDIIAVSDPIKREYEKRCGRNIKVILPMIPFVDSNKSKYELKKFYGLEKTSVVILSLGSIKKIKGSDCLLHAFINLGKEYIEKKHLKLLYIGDGRMRPDLEKIINDKGFNDYVKFFGIIPYENVPDMYKLADIYVIPSLFEGTPKSLLEAMFNSLPIIGSNTSGINNIIVNNVNGLLFDLSNEKDLSNKLKNIIEDHDLRKYLGEGAKNYFQEDYNYEKTVLDFIDIYRNRK